MPLAGSICTSGQVEKSFRMSKTDLAARPIFHHTRESIEAHLTIVFAALAMSRWVENTTGWSIKRFVTTARRCRTIQIQAGEHTITAADPYPTTSTPRSTRSTARTNWPKSGLIRSWRCLPGCRANTTPLDHGVLYASRPRRCRVRCAIIACCPGRW
jgi:hypothetical protein